MAKIADPIKVNEKGLLVRSVMSKSECKRRKFEYEWYIDLQAYCFDKESTQRHLGLTDEDFLRWLKTLTQKRVQLRRDKHN